VENQSDPESWRDIECQLTMPPLYKRWLAEGLNEKEQLFFGRKILEGVVEAYPALAGSEINKVAGGIVKSNGEVNIRKTDSNFHERSDHGLTKRQIGYSDFNGVKLFYGESQAREVVDNIVGDIRSNVLIEKEVMGPRKVDSDVVKEGQREYMLNSYVRRYASEQALNRRSFSQLKSRTGADVANQASISYMHDALEAMLNLYLKEPKLTRNMFTPFVGKIAQSIGDAAKTIIDGKESDICKEEKLEEQQRRIGLNLPTNKYPKLFTVFSIIDSEGNIIFDGKYGAVTESKRQQYEIPSLKNRDYVQEMIRSGTTKFVCGSPVIGSTSGEFMIPVGIKANDDFYLTFGMNVAGLMNTIGLKQANSEMYL
jgi:hypothetical protein